MRIRKLYPLALVASVVAVMMCGCDTADLDVAEDTAQGDSVKLAPPRPDQKVYVTPSTGKFHLALCPHLTEDRVVMLVSEAIDQGYEPCDRCFPVPKETEPSVPKVYVVDGDDHYHLAGCVFLDETKRAIPKSEAIGQGYIPCPRCNYGEASPVESRVYILPGDDEHYHINGCPHLSDDKILMLKAEAIEQGYTPCPQCAVASRVPGGVVYICPNSGEKYHGFGCPSLQQCVSIQTVTIWEAKLRGFEPCERCNGRPWPKEVVESSEDDM